MIKKNWYIIKISNNTNCLQIFLKVKILKNLRKLKFNISKNK